MTSPMHHFLSDPISNSLPSAPLPSLVSCFLAWFLAFRQPGTLSPHTHVAHLLRPLFKCTFPAESPLTTPSSLPFPLYSSSQRLAHTDPFYCALFLVGCHVCSLTMVSRWSQLEPAVCPQDRAQGTCLVIVWDGEQRKQ